MGIINSDEFAIVGTANGGELLKPYDVEVNGHQTTVKLTAADARRRGLLGDDVESDEAAELRETVAALEAKLAEAEARATAAETKEREAVEAKEKVEAAAKTEADAKAKAAAANKQAVTPQNKGAAAEAPKV